jgi:hypothetical protein
VDAKGGADDEAPVWPAKGRFLPDEIEFNTEFREDFSTPELPHGMSGGGTVLGSAVRDGFTRELVRAQWRTGDPIDLWIVKPSGVRKPPVILYLYSFPSSNDRYNDLEFCKFLTKDGYAAVGFVSALTGERVHDRPLKQWFISQLQESLGTSVHDVQMVLNYLADRGDMDMTRVGMWGDGSGAGIAIMAAAVDSRIKALDLLDPWGDWPDWLAESSLVPESERAEYLKPEFLSKVANLDPLKWLPQLKTPQIRLQSIKSVNVTPTAARDRLRAVAPANTQIVNYENTHDFITRVAATGKGFDWIKQQLAVMVTLQESKDRGMTGSSPKTGNSEQ